jgi:hypothetical protein
MLPTQPRRKLPHRFRRLHRLRRLARGLQLLPLLLTMAPMAWASNLTGDLPWNRPIEVLRDNITGPTLSALLFIAVAVGVAMWGWSSHNEGVGRAGKAIAALAVIIILATFLQTLGVNYALL